MTDGIGSSTAPGIPLQTAEDAEDFLTTEDTEDTEEFFLFSFTPDLPRASVVPFVFFSASVTYVSSVIFPFFLTFARVSASQAFLVALDTARLLCHSAEPASEAIWSSERLVSTE